MTPDELLSLHRGVLGGNADYRDRLARFLLDRTPRAIEPQFRGVDPSLIEEAVADAVFRYLRCPATFDPARASLTTYIALVARRRVIDALRRDRRRRSAELAAVGLEPRISAPGDPAADRSESMRSAIAGITSRLDRQFARAWLTGAGDQTLALIIGVADHASQDRAQAIRRLKERLRLRLKRVVARRRPNVATPR